MILMMMMIMMIMTKTMMKTNVVATLHPDSPRRLVLAAHYDSKVSYDHEHDHDHDHDHDRDQDDDDDVDGVGVVAQERRCPINPPTSSAFSATLLYTA